MEASALMINSWTRVAPTVPPPSCWILPPFTVAVEIQGSLDAFWSLRVPDCKLTLHKDEPYALSPTKESVPPSTSIVAFRCRLLSIVIFEPKGILIMSGTEIFQLTTTFPSNISAEFWEILNK